MSYIENIYICLAAPLLLTLLCLRRRGRRTLSFLLAGMTACLVGAYITSYFTEVLGIDYVTATHEIAPVVEECVKLLPILFYLLLFEPGKQEAVAGALLVAAGFATFENVCFLTDNGTADLLRLLIRGFSTGAMHVVCGMLVAMGLFFLWDRIWLRTVGVFAMLCTVITFHAVYNVLVNQTGPVFWVGSLIPMTLLLGCLAFLRTRFTLF